MSDLANLDGEVLPLAEARIPVTDEGLLRGDGVFEVLRVYEGRPYALAEHIARMERSAANLRLPLDPEAVRADAVALLDASAPDDALLRLVVTRGGPRLPRPPAGAPRRGGAPRPGPRRRGVALLRREHAGHTPRAGARIRRSAARHAPRPRPGGAHLDLLL